MHVCHDTIDNQVILLTELGELRNQNICMDADSANGKVKTLRCHKMGGNQKWEYDLQASVTEIYLRVYFHYSFFLFFL